MKLVQRILFCYDNEEFKDHKKCLAEMGVLGEGKNENEGFKSNLG